MKNLIFLRLFSQGLMSDFLLETVDLRQSKIRLQKPFPRKILNQTNQYPQAKHKLKKKLIFARDFCHFAETNIIKIPCDK